MLIDICNVANDVGIGQDVVLLTVDLCGLGVVFASHREIAFVASLTTVKDSLSCGNHDGGRIQRNDHSGEEAKTMIKARQPKSRFLAQSTSLSVRNDKQRSNGKREKNPQGREESGELDRRRPR